MKIRLHIERLVLDGLPVSGLQGPVVQAAVERELTHLLTGSGLSHEFRAGGAVPNLRSRNIRLEQGSQPQAVGRQIAGAVYSGIGNHTK